MRVSILKRGPKSFRLRIETKDAAGRRHFDYESFASQGEAEARKAALLASLQPVQARSSAPTLSQAFDAYIAEAEQLGIISGSSAGQYRITQKLYLGGLADRPVDQIASEAVKSHLIGLAGRLAAPTLRAVRAKISRVLKHQIEVGSIGKNVKRRRTLTPDRRPKLTPLGCSETQLSARRSWSGLRSRADFGWVRLGS